MEIWLIVFILPLIQGAKEVEYRFGYNYGQIFRDFSYNGRHAVNGDYHSNTYEDFHTSDRGTYSKGGQYTIMMPKNSYVTSDIKLESPFTVLFWCMALDSTGYVFSRYKSSSDYLTISQISTTDSLTFRVNIAGSDSNSVYGVSNSFMKNIWVMITLEVSGKTFRLYQNKEVQISYSSPNEYSETGSYNMFFGSGTPSYNAFKGYIWYFVILNTLNEQSSYFSDSSSTNCLTSHCSSCTYSIVDPYEGTGCISTETDYTKNSQGTLCSSYYSYSCSSTGVFSCGCSTSSCYQSGNKNYCSCPDVITTPSESSCVCPSGYTLRYDLCCESSCLTCSSSSTTTCLTCVSSYSSPNGSSGCKCNDGYYGATPLLSASSCSACHSECATCQQASKCLTCKSSGAVPHSTAGCVCQARHYGSSPLTSATSCKACHAHCELCTQANICLTCIATNAFPKSTSGCFCPEKYYSDGLLTTVNSCSACHEDCATCDRANVCLTCIALNSSPSSVSGCVCNDMFYSIGALDEVGSCLACHSDCLTCNQKDLCLKCKVVDAIPDSQSGCTCNKKYYFDQSSQECKKCINNCITCTSGSSCNECKERTYGALCYDCHSECQSCSGPEFYNCLSCSKLMLENTCTDTCPVGFKSKDKICQNNKPDLPTLQFKFEEIGEMFFDQSNNISAIIRKDFKRRLSDFSPKVAFGRGIYFPGSSGLEISEKSKIFNRDFSVRIWSRPKTSSGTLLSKYDQNQNFEYLRLSYKRLSIKAEISIENSKKSCNSSNELVLNEWSHLLIAVSFSSGCLVRISLNNIPEVFSISDNPFRDSDTSLMMIGSDSNLEDSFEGFFYLFEIYAFYESKELASISSCKSCDVCLVSGTCLSTCEVNQYFNEETKSCKNCPSDCLNSCINSSTCLKCADKYCKFCSDFSQGSCYECLSGYELRNKTCQKCEDRQFFDEKKKVCKNCPFLCFKCFDGSKCTKCEENAVVEDSKCTCMKGFSLQDKCRRNNFTAELTINEKNEILLSFSEPLEKKIEKNLITLKIDSHVTTFEVITEDYSNYRIKIHEKNIKSNSTLHIIFNKDIISENNSLLIEKELSGNLFMSQEVRKSDSDEKTDNSKNIGTIGMVVGVSMSLLIAVTLKDPTLLFYFLSTAEILYSVYLFDYDLNPILSNFLVGLRLQDNFPNIFYFFLDSSKGVELSDSLKDFGYSIGISDNRVVQWSSLRKSS